MKRIQYVLVELFNSYSNLYEIFKDKIFVGVSKSTKSTKILAPESFRLYSMYVFPHILLHCDTKEAHISNDYRVESDGLFKRKKVTTP